MAADTGNGGTHPGGPEPPASPEEALARAAGHARLAAAETLRTVRALADAGALAAGAGPLAEDSTLGLVARSLDELASALAAGADGAGSSVLRAVAEALDAEIARWEERAREDGDARAVLRAYLGLREILWELGVRPRSSEGEPGRRQPRGGRGAGRGRVQRVPVEERVLASGRCLPS
jgi:hypothetical protein